MKRFKGELNEVQVKYKRTETKKAKIERSQDADEILRGLFTVDLDYREQMIALYLNRKNITCGFAQIGVGGVASCDADLKIIFQHGLLCHASAFVIAHNHPSGSLEASKADINLTKRIKEVGKILDMQLLDHLIITSESYYSFADEGIL